MLSAAITTFHTSASLTAINENPVGKGAYVTHPHCMRIFLPFAQPLDVAPVENSLSTYRCRTVICNRQRQRSVGVFLLPTGGSEVVGEYVNVTLVYAF